MTYDYPLHHPAYTIESNLTLANHDPITREYIKECELNKVLLAALENKTDDGIVINVLLGIVVLLMITLLKVPV